MLKLKILKKRIDISFEIVVAFKNDKLEMQKISNRTPPITYKIGTDLVLDEKHVIIILY